MRLLAYLPLALVLQSSYAYPASFDDYVAEARQAAGTRWADRVDRFCGLGARPEMRDPSEGVALPITLPEVPNWPEPAVKIFDDVYFVGSKGVSAFALVTPNGIVITDAMWAYDVERSVSGGLRSFGIDPTQIKYVIIPHGHPDHYGGANYLHEAFGAKIVVPHGDIDTIKEYERRDTTPIPKAFDVLIGDGDVLSLGKTKVSFHLMPGHTPGGIVLSFPVHDKGKRHTMLVWAAGGGTPNTAAKLQAQIPAMETLIKRATVGNFDALADNHGSHVPAAEFSKNPGAGNPFLVGNHDLLGYLKMRLSCDHARLVRLQDVK